VTWFAARLLAALALLPGVVHADPLTLDEVIDSVKRAHPLRAAAEQGVARAQGQLTAAQGAFDPRIRVRGQDTPAGYYDPFIVDVEVRAPTTFHGVTPFAGWRLGLGELPPYDWKQRTLEHGELRAGVELPLLRDRSIDRSRGDIAKAELAIAVATADTRQRTLELQREAASTYWDWVASGHRLALREAQLELARARDEGLRRAVAAGNTAQIAAGNTAIDGTINHAADMIAAVGLNAARLDRLTENSALRAISTAEERSALEDTDLSAAIAELNGMTLTLEAAQAAFARINRRTLMDFQS